MKTINDVLGLTNDEIFVELIKDYSNTIVIGFYLQGIGNSSNWACFDFDYNEGVTYNEVVRVEYSPQFNPEYGWHEDVEVLMIKSDVEYLNVEDLSSYNEHMNNNDVLGENFSVKIPKELITLINQSMIEFYINKDS